MNFNELLKDIQDEFIKAVEGDTFCEGYGTEVACNGSRMVPCSHPQCSNGRLIDSKNKS